MGRAPCCAKVGLHRGPWTPREDTLLTNYIQAHGEGNWRSLPKKAGLLRCGKSCRLRWMNYLRPDIKRGNISSDEDDLIIRLHTLLGNRWSLIAGRLPGRTDNEIKNYWNTHLSKRPGIQGTNRKVADRSQRKPVKRKVNAKKPVEESTGAITKQKVHLPKPFRVRRKYSFEEVHNCNNSSNDNNGTCGSSSQEKGFSPEGTSTSTSIDHHDDYHGLGFLMIVSDIVDDHRNDMINPDDLDHHQRDLNMIYEEYLAQLLKTCEGDQNHEHDQFELDSFAESLLI